MFLFFFLPDGLDGKVAIPECEYVVRNVVNDEIVDEINIGDMVRHRWSCNADVLQHNFCLIITNCFLIASDSKYQLIDNEGCSMDRSILPDLFYIDNVCIFVLFF